tara:strand:- start:55 stop:519 length:465 start_codon:yes stop_codon:yes gene_type:complete
MVKFKLVKTKKMYADQYLIEAIRAKHCEILKKRSENNNGTLHFQASTVRPLMLLINREFDTLDKDCGFTRYMRTVYIKINTFLIEIESYNAILNIRCLSVKHLNYLQLFRNNLLKLKKKCEDSSIMNYNGLPGGKLPLDIRRIIVSYISIAPMK